MNKLIGSRLSLNRQQAAAILFWIWQPRTSAPVCNILQHDIHWDSSQRLLKAERSSTSWDLDTFEMFHSFKTCCYHCERRRPGKPCPWQYSVEAMKELQISTITGLEVLYCWSFFSNNVLRQKYSVQAILCELSPIAKCTSSKGHAAESFEFTISCQVSHKFPPETQREYMLDRKKETYRS